MVAVGLFGSRSEGLFGGLDKNVSRYLVKILNFHSNLALDLKNTNLKIFHRK